MLYQTKNPHGGDIYAENISLDFSANTNPLGTPPGVLDAMARALSDIHRYPDPYCRELVAALSAFEEVPKEAILCGNGAAELIYAYCQALRPRRALELSPTFSEYSLALERVGCQVTRYPLARENLFDLDEGFWPALERAAPEAIFLCSPNNPTGRPLPPQVLPRLLDWCRRHEARLFLDECFLDLSDGGSGGKPALARYPQLLLLKAFTKSYGMAGVRLGYCLCSDGALLCEMSRTAQPWNVSLLAQAAGVAALRESRFLEQTRALLREERPRLKQGLEELGFWVCPSSANYLLFQGSAGLHTALKRDGICIRSCANFHVLSAGWYRAAVRRREENEALLSAIRAAKEEEPWPGAS